MICCFGDSNTYGYDPRSPLGEPYPQNWCGLLREYQVLNLGINGRTVPARSPQLLAALGPDTELLIVMLGTNDLLQGDTPEQVADRMENLLKTLREQRPGLRVLLLTPPPICIPGFGESRNQLAAQYADLSRRMGLMYLDTDCMGLSMAFDGVHLSENGHMQLAGYLSEFLKTAKE